MVNIGLLYLYRKFNLKQVIMKAPAHLSKVYQKLWEYEFKFYNETLNYSEEESMEKANQKIQNTERLLAKESESEWVDISTGKKVKYGGW